MVHGQPIQQSYHFRSRRVVGLQQKVINIMKSLSINFEELFNQIASNSSSEPPPTLHLDQKILPKPTKANTNSAILFVIKQVQRPPPPPQQKFTFTPKLNKKSLQLCLTLPKRESLYTTKSLNIPCIETWKLSQTGKMKHNRTPSANNKIISKAPKKPGKSFLQRQEECERKKQIRLEMERQLRLYSLTGR